MDAPINIEMLRRDLMNHYGAAIFAGFDSVMSDLLELDNASEEELIRHAKKEGIDVRKYQEQSK